MAQTSDRVSEIAARLVRTSAEDIMTRFDIYDEAKAEMLAADIRTLAASALRQDETRGLRGALRRLIRR